MNAKDIHNNLKTSRGVSPAAIITGNVTTTSQIIDTQGFESCEFLVISGTMTDGTQTCTMFEDDAVGMGTESAVVAGDLIGAAPVILATDDDVVKKVGYKGAKRYVRLKAVQTGATTGGFLAIAVVQSGARNAPVT